MKTKEYKITFRMDAKMHSDFRKYIERNYSEKANNSEVLRTIINDYLAHNKRIKASPDTDIINTIEKELYHSIKQEIKQIGINLNQMARTVNAIYKMNGAISNSTEKRFSKSLELMKEHIIDIITRIEYLYHDS